jgi:hypothetical protein
MLISVSAFSFFKILFLLFICAYNAVFSSKHLFALLYKFSYCNKYILHVARVSLSLSLSLCLCLFFLSLKA